MFGWMVKALSATVARNLRLIDPALARLGWADGSSYAGKAVTVDTALQLSTNYACVRLISQTFGTLPVEVRVWDGVASRPTRDHPLYGLLHDAPNADMTGVEFWSAMGVSLLTWGNAYAEVSRVFDRVVALTPLDPALVSLRRGGNGGMVYRYSDPGGARDLDENAVLHIKNVTREGIVGLSPVAQARHSLGLAMAADEAAGKLFANGMRTGGYISVPQVLSQEQRNRAEGLLAKFRGAENSGKVPILEAGWKYEPLTMPPQEAQLLATREFGVEEVCRWYGVPPFMVGHTSKVTSWGSGLEQQMLGFYQLTLRPIIKNAEQAIKRRLVAPGERSYVDVDFNVEGLLRADSAGRAAYLKTMVEAGIYTRNEARSYEGKGPLPGGDALTAQAQNVPLSQLGHNGGPPLERVP